jgi:hypothetical protein
MIAGAAVLGSTGTDLDGALLDGTVGEYLTEAAASSTALTVNLGLWILGALLMGLGGGVLAGQARSGWPAATARFGFTAGPAAAVMFFSIWLGIVLGLAPAHVAGESVISTAVALGHTATIADWIGTVLILSVGGGALALSGRGTWSPRWLVVWGIAAAVAGAVAIIGLIIGQRGMGFIVVPVGFGLVIACAVTVIRRS